MRFSAKQGWSGDWAGQRCAITGITTPGFALIAIHSTSLPPATFTATFTCYIHWWRHLVHTLVHSLLHPPKHYSLVNPLVHRLVHTLVQTLLHTQIRLVQALVYLPSVCTTVGEHWGGSNAGKMWNFTPNQFAGRHFKQLRGVLSKLGAK